MPITRTNLAELKRLGLTSAQIKRVAKIKTTPLPSTTKLTDMGFNPKLVAKLSPNLRQLTKADLLSLGGWGTTKLTQNASRISVQDVQQIKDVLGRSFGSGGVNPVAMDVYCCCCPCCCAATVENPVAIRKEASVVV